ncbi:MAG: peptidoglycan recognition family protein [Ilumatobacteraceae bacterium]
MCECEREPTRREILRGAAVRGAAAVTVAGAATWGLDTGAARPSGRRTVGADRHGINGAGAANRGPAAASAPTVDAAAYDATAVSGAVQVMPGLYIRPRDVWGADLPPKGDIARETTKFLLVHHTASPNDYASARDVIRSAYAWQTGPEKGWPDVCYGFFIGRDGDVWQGREGSLVRPVRADATGGNQGYAQLVCLLGNFTLTAPTAAAQTSLVKVLAWLAGRDLVSLADGATTTFVSRGSNRWPAGSVVTTPTIAGHRDMSYTACPGDALYPLLPDLRRRARDQFTSWRTVTRPAVRLDG